MNSDGFSRERKRETPGLPASRVRPPVAGLTPETPVLMGDGRVKPLDKVRPGDSVYGTERVGRYRRFVTSKVREVERDFASVYRIVADPDIGLSASQDLRLLSNRGWKYITGTQHGSFQRPHLTLANELLGLRSLSVTPPGSPAYRLGYLCGMIRGDGTIGTYSYDRPGRNSSEVHRFRLALVDTEALGRSQEYLRSIGVVTKRFLFSEASATRKAMWAIRSSSRGAIDTIERAIAWPQNRSVDWERGFLAGIYDAEGGFSRGVLRVSNSDCEILDMTLSLLKDRGFDAVSEPARPNGVVAIRIRGGMNEQLKFFLDVDPAITRKRSLLGTAIKTTLRHQVRSLKLLATRRPVVCLSTSTGDFIANGVVVGSGLAIPGHEMSGAEGI